MKQVYGSLMSTLVSVLFLGVFFLGNQEEAKAQCTSVSFVSCPSDTILYPPFPPEICDALVVLNPPTAVAAPAACGTPTVTAIAGITASGTYPVGTYTIVWVASAPGVPTSGWDTCTYNLTIADTVRPRLTNCPGDIVIDQEPDTCGAVATWVAPTATDACGVTMTSNFNSGDFFPVGVTVVEYIAEDPSGNTNICSFTVTVNDTAAPVITFCPGDTTINLTSADACPLPVTLPLIQYEDDCDASVSWTYSGATIGSSPFTASCYGVANCRSFAIDRDPVSGNVYLISGNPRALYQLDLTTYEASFITLLSSPVSGDPLTQDFSFNSAGEAVIFYQNGEVAKLDMGTLTQTSFATLPGYFGGVGVTYDSDLGDLIHVNAAGELRRIDAAGVVTVVGTFPIPCSAQGIEYVGGGIAYFSSTYGCDYLYSLDLNTLATTLVVDPMGTPYDNTKDLLYNAAGDFFYGIFPWEAINNVYQIDRLTGSVSNVNTIEVLRNSASYPDASGIFNVGVTTVTYSVTDGTNTTTCSFTVTVNDVVDPTINCGSTVTGNADAGLCTTTLSTTITGGDNCTYTITNDYNGQSSTDGDLSFSDVFPVGTTTVTFTVTDGVGNTSTCELDFTVNDNQNPLISVCPGDATIFVDGTCSATLPDYTGGVTASDNCGVQSITQSPVAGTAYTNGDVVTVVFTVTDVNGNTTTCSNTVTFVDNIPPTFDNCPTSETVGNDAGNCDYVYTFSLPTASDNCDPAVGVVQTAGPASPATLAVGSTTTFTFVATDANGNTTSCSYSITVQDQENPVISTCPADDTVVLDATCDGLLPDLTGSAVFTDNCGATIAQSPAAGTPYNGAQDVTVTFTVTDAAGNTATCSATVSFVDTQVPVVSCPGPQTINTSDDGTGDCSAFVTVFPSITITENCDFTLISFVVNNGDTIANYNQPSFNIAPGPTTLNFTAPYALGTNTVILNVVDESGNSASCSHDVIVVDDEDPTITCPGAVTQGNDLDTCGAVVNFTVTATDNCSYVITNDYNMQAANNTSLAFTDYFVLGTTTVVFTVTDTAGNTATCSVDITINDVQGPDLTCPQNIETNTINSLVCYDIVTWTPPIPDDNCPGLVTLTQTTSWPNPGLYAANGWKDPYVVAYVAQDAAGNTSTCSFTITIFDTVTPYFVNCPANVTIPADPAGCNTEYIWTPPTGVDNCAGLAVTASHAPGYTFQVGTTRVWYAAIDSSGNSDTCEFFVTVEDIIPPVLTCVGDTTINNDLDECGAIYTFDLPGIEDECDTVATVLRSTVKRYIYEDGDIVSVPDLNIYMIPGTVAVGDVTVNVYHRGDIGDSDEQFDVLDEAGNLLGETNDGSDCDPNYVVTTFTISEADFNAYALDGVVEFNMVPVDDETNDFCAPNDDAYIEVVFSENNLTLTQTAGLASGSLFPVGVTTQVFEVTDASGNVTTCTWDVTVLDVQAPDVNCPDDIVVNNDPGVCSADVTVEPNCASLPGFTGYYAPANWTIIQEGNGFVDVSGAPNSINLVGSNDPLFIIEDEFDNGVEIVIPCDGVLSFDWDYETFDTDGPAFDPFGYLLNGVFVEVSDPSGADVQSGSVVLNLEAGDVFAFIQRAGDNLYGAATTVAANFTAPTSIVFATDNCGIASIVNDYNGTSDASDTYPVGTTTVTFTVTDIYGNVTTCSFDVTVIDNEAPVVTCQNTNVFLDAAGTGSITTADVVQFVDDNCGIATIVQSQNDFTCADVGVNTIITTVTDVNGNTATCSSVVTVFDAIAPTALCQNITVQLDATGNASITANDIDNGSFDNCGIASLVASQTAFTCGDLGVVPVTLTVTDVNGNVSQCVALVTVEDNIAPAALCQDVTIFLDATGNASITTADIDNGSTDNCTIVDISLSQTAFDCGDVGLNTVVLSVEDQSGNISTCSATVTVVDAIAPTAICQNAVVFLDAAGNGSVTVADINNGSFDNCGIASITLSQSSFDCSHVGIVTITMTVTDVNGLVSNCTAEVTVIDNVNPVALCQNITVQLDATGNVSITANDIDNGSNDACGIASLVASQTAFDCNDLGPNLVTLTVTDVNGNVSQCVAIVTVEDNVNPTALCQNITVYLDNNGEVSITAADVDNGSFDNCTIVDYAINIEDFDCSNVGANNVTLTVTDQSGNIGQCVAVVTVLDTTRPNIVCPPNFIANNSFGLCGNAIQGFQLAQLTDNCGIQSVVNDWTINGANASAFYPVGVTVVTWLATDVNGNTATCSATVTINDFERPTINVPSNIVVNSDPGVCGAVVNFTVNYFENCPNDTFTQTSGLPSGSVFPVGTTVNSYFAVDEAGNTNSASFTVTVRDNEAPVFSNCSANITVPNGPGECGAQVFYPTPTASDNCGATVTLVGLGSGAFFPVGTSTETYVAVDAAGNSVSCIFTVTVEDVENPVITCLPDITVSNDLGLCEAVVNFPGILLEEDFESFSTCGTSATTVCNLTNGWVNDPFDSQSDWLVDIGGTSSSNTGPATDYVPGTSTGKYLYLETSGTAGQTANLISPALDLTNATFATLSFWYHMWGATMGTMHVDASIDGGATWTLNVVPAWTDNLNAWQNRVVDMTPFVGNADVHFRVRGIKGTSFTSDMAVDFFQVFSDAVPGQPVFSDNCPGAVMTQIGGLPSGSSYPVGTNVVTYQVVDASGNIATCSFNVIVNDTEGPVVTCGPDVTVNTSDDGTGDCTVAFTADYVISDNCTNDDITVDINITNGGSSIFSSNNVQVGGAYTETYTLELGANLITYTITDTNGNVTVCSRTITVLDDEAPVIICPADITVSNDPGVCSAAVTVPAPAASDNCSFAITNDFNGTADASGVYPVGTTAVTFTITDAGNNVSFCTFNVTVEDTEAPVISGCPTDTTLPSDTGLCGALFIFTAPTAADNCPGLTFAQTAGLPSLSIFPVGATVVEYTATDAAGNTTVCSFTVTVVDVEAPTVIDCPGDITVPSDFGVCGAQVFWQDPFAFDNCVDFAWTSNFVSGDVLPVGTTTVVYVATDSAGNTAVCSFNVTVEDVEAPVFTSCPADIFSCDPVQSWTLPTATDNCAVTSIVGTANPGDTFPVGATTVEYVATDAAGNTTLCSFVVNIWPTPVVSAGADQDVCLNSSVTIGGNPTATGATAPYNYSWSPAAGLNSAVDENPVATPLVTTTYTVVVVDANGCTSSDEVTVTVLPLPTADAGADVAICVGTSTTIGGAPTASGTAGPYTFSWAPAAGLSSANAANPTASPAATTTYTVTVTDANGCQSTDEIVVTVNPLPNATITAAGPFCLNDGPQTLTAATAGGSWSGNGITDATAGTFNPAVAGVGVHQITYSVTDANGCFNSATTLIEVLPLPNSRILPAGPYCENDAPVFLTGLPAINPHTWSGPGIVNAQTGQFDPAVAGAGVHTIQYVVTNAVGCTDTATVEITVTGAPAVAITFAGPFCETEPVQTLTANIGGGIWSGPGIIQAQLGQFLPLAASAGTHQIIYEVANSAGCVASDTTFIVVFEVPAITFTTDDASCDDATDGSVNISVSGGTAPYTFSWSNGAITEDLSGVAAGTYTVTVTDANACPQVQSITVGVSVNPVSVAAIVSPANNAATPNGAIDITVNGGVPPYTFVWSNGAQTEDLSGLLPGTYELTIIDDAGCSYVFFYQVGARFGVGIDLVDLNKNINLFPNPTSDVININIEVGGINADMTMSVFDMLGRKVYEVNDAFTGMYSHSIGMTNWAAGQYMVRFNINGQMVTKKFVLAR